MKRGKERTYVKIPENYLEKVYAGWLGKVIGIRLGAAIEGVELPAHPECVWRTVGLSSPV